MPDNASVFLPAATSFARQWKPVSLDHGGIYRRG